MEVIISRSAELKVERADPIAELGMKKSNGGNQGAEEFSKQFSLYLDTCGEKSISTFIEQTTRNGH